MRERIRAIKGWIATTFAPLKPVYDAWMWVIRAFNWVLARVVLTLAFVTVFFAYGVVLRIISKDPLNRGLDSERSSYWGDNVNDNEGLSDFQTQY